jgi:16S rRNA (uracil1498-N3)-methyltransferase
MRQFLLPKDFKGEGYITLTGKDYHYLRHVVRLREEDKLTGRTVSGSLYELTVHKVGKDKMVLKTIKVQEVNTNRENIVLFQSLPKGKKMDTIIRQGTEVGVFKIVPVISENTVVKLLKKEEMEKKIERWKKISREALQQSGLACLPEIAFPIKLKDIPVSHKDINLFCHQEPLRKQSLHSIFHLKRENLKKNFINILVGPEGGFSPLEVKSLEEKGFQPVFLGHTVLRTETAALFILSAVKLLLLEMDFWQAES